MAFRNVVARQRAGLLAKRLKRNFAAELPTEIAAPAGDNLVAIGGRLYESSGANSGSAVTVVNAGRPASALYQPAQGGASSVVIRRAGAAGGGGGGAAHTLYGEMHTGILDDSQAPQFLKTDGSRALTNNLVVNSGVTIDGVDLSAHAANANAHHNQMHSIIGGDHSASGLTPGHALRASGATTFAFAQLQHGDLGGVSANQHHNQLHLLATNTRLGDDHTISGATAGHVLRASAANAAAFAQLQHGDLGGVTSDQHHAKLHSMLDTAHHGYSGGSALDVFGLSGPSTLALIAPSENPGTTDSILKSVAGLLTLPQLTATSKLRSPLIDTASGDLVLRPADDIMLDPDSNLVKLVSPVAIQTENYASQTTGWRATYDGQGDFRYLFADEMHVKSFIADLEQALAGGQIIGKSVGVVAVDFSLPTAGNTGTLRVRDLPSAANMAVFQSGDFVGLRQFSRAGGSLTAAWAWGTVTNHVDQPDGTQTWTFTRHATIPGSASGTVPADAFALDFGVSGNGYYEVNAIDGAYAANSPYSQTVRWTTHPANLTVTTRQGNLAGLFGEAGEVGLYAGNGVLDSSGYLRLSSSHADLHNLALKFYDGADLVGSWAPGSGIEFIVDSAPGVASAQYVSWIDPDDDATSRLVRSTRWNMVGYPQAMTSEDKTSVGVGNIGQHLVGVSSFNSGPTPGESANLLFQVDRSAGVAKAWAKLYGASRLFAESPRVYFKLGGSTVLNDYQDEPSEGIALTGEWSGYPDRSSGSEISNDTNIYRALMLVGNKSAGGNRRMRIYDELSIAGAAFNATLNVAGTTELNGATARPLKLTTSSADPYALEIHRSDLGNSVQMYNSGGALYVNAPITVIGNMVWHAGNDGSASGLDADTLDGQQGAYYLPASSYSASDVLTKLVTVDGSSSGLDADLLDGQQGAYYLPASSYSASDVLAKLLTVDGGGSGLDADLVDGLHASAFWTSSNWIALSFTSPWANYDTANWGTLSYRKVGDLVFVVGMVQRDSTVESNMVVATLPVGYRPGKHNTFMVNSSLGAGSGTWQPARINVETSGDIRFVAPYVSQKVAWLSLHGIVFSTQTN